MKIRMKFFDGMDVWWCFPQHIARILHVTHANHRVMTHGSHYYSDWNESQNADFARFKLIKCTNVDINDSGCLHVVHAFYHPTSRPTTTSAEDTMVNAPNKNISPHPGGKCGNSTKQSTCRHHQANEAKWGLGAKWFRAFGLLRMLRSKEKLSAEKRRETDILSNEE